MTADGIPCLTVQNPWAWAIWQAAVDPRAKLAENRGIVAARLTYRGPLLIHAGLRWSERGQFDARVMRLWGGQDPADETAPGVYVEQPHGTKNRIAFETPATPPGLLDHRAWPIYGGAIICQVNLVDIHPDTGCCRPWGESTYVNADGSTTNQVAHMVFEDVRRLSAPLKATGSLGFWYPDAFARQLIDRRLED